MARIVTVPDGKGGYNEVYGAPITAKDANEWMQRAGVSYLKFGTTKGEAWLKNEMTGKKIARAPRISDICYTIAFQPPLMMRLGIPMYDWYRPDEIWNQIGAVNWIFE